MTNYEFVHSLNISQLSGFVVLTIQKFLESQGLSLDEVSQKILIDTYIDWFKQECNVTEIDLGKENDTK